MKRTTKRSKQAAKLAKASPSQNAKAPLLEHLYELRRRLFYVAVSVAVGSAIAYGVERRLIDVLLAPSHGQEFVYTSPMGGINFLFSVCIFFGIVVSIPVIVYNLLKFLQPLMKRSTPRFIFGGSIASGVVALCGILFGYYAGLPAALHFLLKQQFHNGQVEALITIQSYFSFVTAYMVGAAIMFQLPLLLLFINRIKPLTPQMMFKWERAVIIFAFVSAFIMNPTPNVVDQMFVVIPIILMYQLGIGLVWFVNRRNHRLRYKHLFENDVTNRAERLRQAATATPLFSAASVRELLEPLAPRQPELVAVPVSEPQPIPLPEAQNSAILSRPAVQRRSFSTEYIPHKRAGYGRLSSRLVQ